MTDSGALTWLARGVRLLPILFLMAVVFVFGSMSDRFLTLENALAILSQASWLAVAAIGVSLVLLTAGVDLSIGSAMYLAAVVIGLFLKSAPLELMIAGAVVVGAAVGLCNAVMVVRIGLPAFIATLAVAFIGRGLGLWLSSAEMIAAPHAVTAFGRLTLGTVAAATLLAAAVVAVSWVWLTRTEVGPALRAIGADAEGARRVGIPRARILTIAYVAAGGLAGLAGFISFAQTAAATAAFGLNAEFLAIAAAVLGGTSLFGGRGGVFAPVIGAVLVMTVQNGLVLIDANPYAYPVITGGVIFLAALLDVLRGTLASQLERRRILPRDAEA